MLPPSAQRCNVLSSKESADLFDFSQEPVHFTYFFLQESCELPPIIVRHGCQMFSVFVTEIDQL